MSCVSKVVSYSSHCTKQVCSWSQVCIFSQEFDSMSLFASKWVFSWVTVAKNFSSMFFRLAKLKLKELPLGWRFDKCSLEFKTSSYISLHDVIKSFYCCKYYNLKSLLAWTISEFNKAEIFSSCSCGPCPSSNSNNFVHKLFMVFIELSNSEAMTIRSYWHILSFCFKFCNLSNVFS